jgi:hypothetical protein
MRELANGEWTLEFELNPDFTYRPDSYQVTSTQNCLFEKLQNKLGRKVKLILASRIDHKSI